MWIEFAWIFLCFSVNSSHAKESKIDSTVIRTIFHKIMWLKIFYKISREFARIGIIEFARIGFIDKIYSFYCVYLHNISIFNCIHECLTFFSKKKNRKGLSFLFCSFILLAFLPSQHVVWCTNYLTFRFWRLTIQSPLPQLQIKLLSFLFLHNSK
jgi:hypothetical protein